MAVIGVVESEALVAVDISVTLRTAGYEVRGPFADVGEYRPGESHLDLLLVDRDARADSGPELAQSAGPDAGRPPIVFIVSHADRETLDSLKAFDPLGVLIKPFSERELLSTVEIALSRAELERRLQLSESRYRDLFGSSFSAKCVVDTSGIIQETNAAFDRLFGFNNKGLSLARLLEDPSLWDAITAGMGISRQATDMELRMRGAAGKQLTVLASFTTFLDRKKGSIASCEFLDRTEATRLREELAQSQKMEAMGKLAGGIAHDFNNILTTIVGHAQMLKLDIDQSSPLRVDVEGIVSSADRASRLTKQLLGFSRKQTPSPKEIDLCATLLDMGRLLSRLVGDRAVFSVNVPKTPIPVLADAIQIEQALLNLVINARDALEDAQAPRISLEAAIVEAPAKIRTRLRMGGGAAAFSRCARVEVADNGKGMPTEMLDMIFEPFFTTKGSGRGTGLGLAIVASVVKDMGGAIEVQSEVGKGSAFSIYIPLLESDQALRSERKAGQRQPEARDIPALGGRGSILLVDDDEAILGFLARLLERSGADVVAARNAGEALMLSENRAFSLLVADVNMPGLDGPELFRRMKAKEPIDALFISGRIDSRYEIPDGCRLIEKPFSPEEFIDAVAGLLPASPRNQPRIVE